MARDDNNKDEGGSGGITYDSPYYFHPSNHPKQLHENRTPHESATFKAFQRHNGPGLNKERSRARFVEEGNKHCTECNKDGHIREGCFKLIGYPEWWPGKKGEKNKGKAAYVKTETNPILGLTYKDYQLFLKHFSGTGNNNETKPVSNMAHKEDEEGSGFLIQVAPNTLLIYLTFLLTRKPPTSRLLFLSPMGIPSQLKGKGTTFFQGEQKLIEFFIFLISNAIFFPLVALVVTFSCISFSPDFYVMQGLQRRNLIGAGRCEGGLYRMKMVQGRRAMTTTVETWHKILGHASKGKLGKIDFIKTCTIDFDNFCHSCAKAKHIKTPFSF
ncbi:LTR copia-type gag-polypeptide [Tanacetum coccineum]